MKIWIHYGYDANAKKNVFTSQASAILSAKYDHPSWDRLNCIVVACDYDNDSLIARYKGKTFAYTDPSVVAVLQAAPYFEELGEGNSSTTYGYTESYVTSEGHGSEFSASVGASLELEYGPVKAAIEGGYATEIIKEYTESREQTYTTTFEANGENQVILRRTLVYLYDYEISTGYGMKLDIWNGTMTYEHDWEDYGLVVTVPQYPVMTSLSIEQYDEFAKAYNQRFGISTTEEANKIDGAKPYKLDIIGDKAEKYFIASNEGNPFAYASTHNDYANGMELSGSTWMELSHSGGTSQLEYSTSLTTEQSKTRSDGGFFNLTLMAGGGIGSFKAYGGVTTSIESLNSKTFSSAKMTGTNTGGSVQNLNKSESDYRFNWKLIGWKSTGDLFKDVLFVGYAVQGISAPIKPVSDLQAEYTLDSTLGKETIELTWTSPAADYKRTLPTAFEVYRIHSDGEYEKLGTVSSLGADKVHSFTIDAGDYTDNYGAFVVVGITTAIDGINSQESNEAICFLVASYKEVKELIDGMTERVTAAENAIESLQANKADAQAMTAALEELRSAIAALEAVKDAYKSADDTLKTALEQAISNAKDTAISAATELVENAKKELNEAIDQKADTIALTQAVDDLNEAIATANEILETADTANKADLEGKINEAQTALQAAIEKVQENLDAAKEDLENALAGNAADLQKKLNELRKKHDADMEALRKEKDEQISALRKEKDDEISALRKEKDEDISDLRAELAALKNLVNDNKAETDTTVATLASVDDTQEDNVQVLRTVSYIGLGIAGVSFIANIVLFAQMLLEKKRRFAK